MDDQYVEALLDPNKFPATTEHNIDHDCDFTTMFINEKEKEEFFESLEQACYLKNSCQIDPENMILNVTLKEGEEMPDSEGDGEFETIIEIDPSGKWYVKSL